MTGKAFTACLWSDTEGEAAASFYASIFKDSKLGRVDRYAEAGPGPAGAVRAVDFELMGQKFAALIREPQFTFNEAISFQIPYADQAEVDYYWARLSEGGLEIACGWLKDKYGLSWQVIPSVLIDMISDPDPGSAKRVTEAMLAITKLDIVTLQKAYAEPTYADHTSHPGIGGSHDGQGPTRPHRRARSPHARRDASPSATNTRPGIRASPAAGGE
jgi:predicted 3-demethylubiquinone-9 3-methyltransferase (glyoxalase superfamily)